MKKSILSLLIGEILLTSGCSQLIQPSHPIDTTIQQLQGSGNYSPVVGIDVANKQFTSNDYYNVEGIVTAIQDKDLGRDLPRGFFIQAASDNNPQTSDGIFVNTADIKNVKVGDLVKVTAKVTEHYHWTQLTSVAKVDVLKTQQPLPAPVVLDLNNQNFNDALERVEGMRVKIAKVSNLHVTRNYGFDYASHRNNLVLSYKYALMHPNQTEAPHIRPQWNANDGTLVVESFKRAPNGQILWYPDFGLGNGNGNGSSNHYIRINDLVDGLEGVIGYSYGQYRLYVTNKANQNTFVHINDRSPKPPMKRGGNLRIASFNVLNYFNPPYDESRNPLGQNRGAQSEKEFKLQSDKIATAIAHMHADIVGLMEIENNGFDKKSAVADLVNRINSKIKNPADHYTYFTPKNGEKSIGSDAITTQVIYKKNKVTLEDYHIIKMPEQHAPTVHYMDKNRNKTFYGSVHQRDTIAPTFRINGTDKIITVAVNHFKSKGSVCWEDVNTGKKLDLDQQGACENLRVAAAERLGTALAQIKGNKIILGDLNSYANEDPLIVLTNRNHLTNHVTKAAGYTYIGGNKATGTPLYGKDGKVINHSFGYINIIRQLHPESYSFAYNNHIGTLDYILISPPLKRAVIDAHEWNINAGESTLFEYSDKHNCSHGICSIRHHDIYRASDHDPAIIDLDTHKI
ncbi:ExeM/NucH family extracellular endonuclease [Actinobacillus delphinicola]|uniref:Uncharacterized protein conserved in bacteria n=1 Tax=Actinobacillus delphinicola TaxID=51161 RepID=A0A448TU20_9PAST|nr:ExeM/NucH family extracellular endonuclease [Actinobacillus delphinicola]VEJ09436.1 Uncharacterized protein conserved in bacteria [Actinobacillus delphinicola]